MLKLIVTMSTSCSAAYSNARQARYGPPRATTGISLARGATPVITPPVPSPITREDVSVPCWRLPASSTSHFMRVKWKP